MKSVLALASVCIAASSLLAQNAAISAPPPATEPTHEIVLIVGAAGEETYQRNFTSAAEAWREAAKQAGAKITTIGLNDTGTDAPSPAGSVSRNDRDRLQAALAALDPKASFPAWIVYLGHGTFDRKQAWLNLRGPDVSAAEFSQWLSPIARRPLIVVHGGSASGPFLPLLSGPNRILITATRSGDEVNYTRFGERFARAVASPDADIDQDGATSLLEAYLQAAKETQASYKEANRMATEHALLDDNGDKLGTPAEWFEGVRVVKRPDNKSAAPDGFRARQIALREPPATAMLTPEQRESRDRLEQELEALRSRRQQFSESAYLRELERVLRQLAPFYRED